MSDYKIFTRDGAQYIERLTYPRFTARIDMSDPLPQLLDIEREDPVMITDAGELAMFWAKITREAFDFIHNRINKQ